MPGGLDPNQLAVAFVAGTATVSAAVIGAGALVLTARRTGRTEDAVQALRRELAPRLDHMDQRLDRADQRADEKDEHDRELEHRVDLIEQAPAVAAHLAAARGWRPPRPRPATDAG